MGLNHIASALHTAEVQAEVLGAAETKALVVRLQERLGVDVTAHAPWDDSAAPEILSLVGEPLRNR